MTSPDGPTTAAPRRLRVAMALYGDISHDSRVIREADTLAAAGHDVTVFCLSGAPDRPTQFRTVALMPRHASVLPDGSSPFLREGPRSRIGRLTDRLRWGSGYIRTVRAWGRQIVGAAGRVDVWHAHDLTGMLAVAPLVKEPTALVYDSHEIFLETGTAARLPGPARRLLAAYERRLTGKAAALITVNDGCAELLAQRLHPRAVAVVRNCPPAWTPPASGPNPLRAAAGVTDETFLALYHGGLTARRGIEETIEALLVPGMEDVHLAFLGYGPMRDAIAAQAADPRFGGRLHLVDAVSPDEVLRHVAGADVNVMALQPMLNHFLGTPNKLWESLAAGVPVVVSDFPEMRRVVQNAPNEPLGAMCDPTSPASIAAAIRTVADASPADRLALRARCLDAAHRRWNWERESEALLGVYAGIAAG